MPDQTVASLTDRLAGRGYDPGDKTDVEVTLKEGFHTVLAEMREDQAAGTATYDGLLPSPPPGKRPDPDQCATCGHTSELHKNTDTLGCHGDRYPGVTMGEAKATFRCACPTFSPPPGEPDEGATGHIAAMERVAVDALRSKRDGYRSVIQEIADTSEDAATVRFARRALGFDEGER